MYNNYGGFDMDKLDNIVNNYKNANEITLANKKDAISQLLELRKRTIRLIDNANKVGVLIETGKIHEAFDRLEGLEDSAKEYIEGSERFILRCQLEKGISLSKLGSHQEAKECLINALSKGKHLYGYSEKIVLKLAYAIAVEDYFLNAYDECMNQLNEILPHVIKLFTDNSEFVYMIKAQMIRCEEARSNTN